MEKAIGHKKWCIPDMHLTANGTAPTPAHECISFVNTGKQDALVTMTLLFADERDPIVLENIVVVPMKSVRLRTDQLEAWNVEIPVYTPYSAVIESTEKIVVDYSRLNWIDGFAQSFGGISYYEE